ncbi:MAG: hypothetical protein O9282_10200 [Flavobacterium sp.]|jgi:hypothetical protein|uniref:hypothetical protein n=1 Tax=Flavobacterium sp. TaxID=239 RepID=UPI0022BD8BE7|nr:hypothetical protein [Flavobacterium sp.]MCZ8090945.1 hypothetical protein [Flavobacterium sp.]MCZ8331671.1 hypothetical protein [Flavobacterium sp.]
MKNFEEFVNHIVTKWKAESKLILEKGGLGVPMPNRTAGDFAEKFIINKIGQLTPKYKSFLASGSQTPADIYSMARRDGYWHIMLIQVKSSKVKDNIYELSATEIKQFSELAKLIKSEITNCDILKDYKKKPIIITTGYAGVFSIETNRTLQHRLTKAKTYKLFKMNAAKLDFTIIIEKLITSHKLGLK